MIAALLGWTKLPSWAMDVIALAVVGGAIWFWQHERYEAGIAAQITADKIQTQKNKADADAQTAVLLAQATTAETNYEKEHQALLDYQSANPIEPVRLCLTTNGPKLLPQTGAAQPGAAATGAAPGNVQPVPSGNSVLRQNAGPDIATLLGLLAVQADNVSARLREYQKR